MFVRLVTVSTPADPDSAGWIRLDVISDSLDVESRYHDILGPDADLEAAGRAMAESLGLAIDTIESMEQ